jgi:AsmA protein
VLYDGKRKFLSIDSSIVYIEGAKFNLAGTVDIQEDNDMNLEIDLADRDFSILSFVFNDDFIKQNSKNLLKGDLNLQAKIIGKASIEVPYIVINFNAHNVNIYLPKAGKSIKDLNLDGYITTGAKKDFSEAEFRVEDFRAQLPDGETRGNLTLKNLKEPFIDIDWYLKTDISGFNGVLKTNMIDSLSGTITLDIDTEGMIDLKHQRIISDKYKANLLIEDASVRIPEIISLDNINGQIRRENLDLLFEDLHIVSNRSDVTINGSVKNILFLAFNTDSSVTADLNVTSNIFDLPEVFAFNPGMKSSLNHILHNLDLEVQATTTPAKLLNFDLFPGVDFKIYSLNSSLDDFPDIKMINSNLSFYENASGYTIQFDFLDIYTAGGNLTLSGTYYGSTWKPHSLLIQTRVKNLNMLDLLNQLEVNQDSTSFLNFIFSGSFKMNFEIPKDSLLFKTLKLADADLTVYHLAYNDTVLIKSLTIDLKDIYYNPELNSNPLATLTTSGSIYVAQIKNKSFDEKNVKFTITTNEGMYNIIPDSDRFFRTKGDGLITAQPWAEVPTYRVQYDVERFAMEDWLANFMDHPVISGPMSFHLDLHMSGDDWDNLLKEIKGTIYSEGNNLRLYGLNLDNVIAKVKRSRHFTLLDIGAVVFAGPVGLAVTKGLDAVSLIAGNKGEVTVIPKLVSNWNIKDGKLEVSDVAFATEKNRIAAKGYINVADDTLSITFAILNREGSASLSQNIHGHLDKQEFGDIKIIESIFAPVTNLFDFVLPINDEIFYKGTVKNPQ